jgi:hypothetical protein
LQREGSISLHVKLSGGSGASNTALTKTVEELESPGVTTSIYEEKKEIDR